MANSVPMTTQEAIRALFQRGYSQRKIARELGIHRKTVGNYLEQEAEVANPPDDSKCTTPIPGLRGEAPAEFIGRQLWVRSDGRMVHLFNLQMEQVAVHVRLDPGEFTKVLGCGGMAKSVRHSLKLWTRRAAEVGPDLGLWAEGLVGVRWRWPDKFLNRMSDVNTRVILVNGDGGWSEGFDSECDLEFIPEGFNGFIWSNRADRVSESEWFKP